MSEQAHGTHGDSELARERPRQHRPHLQLLSAASRAPTLSHLFATLPIDSHLRASRVRARDREAGSARSVRPRGVPQRRGS